MDLRDIPRPSMVCPNGPHLQHTLINVYHRPWYKLFRKEYYRACLHCDEVRLAPYMGRRINA